MGLLERLRGEGNTARFDDVEADVTYTVSPASHTIAFAIAVSAAERDALADLVRADETATGHEETLTTAVSAALDDEVADPDAVVDRIRRPRRVAAAVAETWEELLTDDPDVVYLPVGMAGELAAFVATCRERDANADDSFTLPDTFERVASLVVRIKGATERPDNRIVVHRDRVPAVEPTVRSGVDEPSQSSAERAESEESS
ncbi:hypothetical protein [Halovivax cerinus]|uniref:Uncharacterized protein n=1 Tax=Halovivax cerinus TaxID=1487865 RepID=A0ABD5NLP5_9EURY|nr:hypothetical protein [Halovivax cerinus]